MPIIQDSRMTEEAKESAEDFLDSIALCDEPDLVEFALDLLREHPTLIYARDENGNTAINHAIVSGTQNNLIALRAILAVARENEVLPDFRIENEDGGNAYHMLQVHVDRRINDEFAAELGIDVSDINERYEQRCEQRRIEEVEHLEAVAARAREIWNAQLEREAQQRREDEYFNDNPRHKTIDKLTTGKTTIYTALTDEPTYSDELKDLFSKQNYLFNPNNFDAQKEMNKMEAEMKDILEGFSFTPKSFAFASLESESSFIIIPQDLGNFFYKLHDYLFGNQDSHQ